MGASAPLFAVEADFSYKFAAADGDIVAFMDTVVDHLTEALHAEDVFVVLDEDRATFALHTLVPSYEGESVETIVGKGMGLFRTAFHACNASTPNWPKAHATGGVRVTPIEADAAVDLIDA